MAGFRPIGNNGCAPNTYINPGDTLLTPDTPTVVASATTTVLVAAALVAGVLVRTGATGGAIADTFDTANNIINALASNANFGIPMVEPGVSFKVRLINTTANIDTVAATAGSGIILSTGGTNNYAVAVGGWKDFLLTINAVQPATSANGSTTNGSPAVTFTLAAGQTALPIGPSQYADNLQVGATVTGTGIPNGTTVLGLTYGQGGIIGVTLSANATATGATQLTFSSTITVTSLGGGAA